MKQKTLGYLQSALSLFALGSVFLRLLEAPLTFKFFIATIQRSITPLLLSIAVLITGIYNIFKKEKKK